MTLTFNIQDDKAQEFIDAACQNNFYHAMKDNAEGNPAPNPETKPQFAKRMVAEWMKSQIVHARDQASLRQNYLDCQEITID